MKTVYLSELKELEGKTFESIADLKKAEAEVQEKKNAVEKVKAERVADVAKVQDLANAYLKAVADNNKKRAELRKNENDLYSKYKDELDAFAKKHKGYHLTYTIDGDQCEFKLEEVRNDELEKQIDEHRKLAKMLMDFPFVW